jgi:outer membrane receptor protein involved in Fe transport
MIMGQDLRTNGVFGYLPSVGDLKVQRYQPDTDRDRWAQAGLTVNGKIGNFDLTYAGSLFVRDVHQRIDYSDYTAAYAGYSQYFLGADGLPLANQLQFQDDKDHFTKVSNEIRLASPSTDRLRFIVGAFQELQTHHILQDYEILGLSPQLSIPTRANTIWLTDQMRRDTDYAAFTEVSYDILPKLTLTGGVRPYYYDNSLKGFFGFSEGIAGSGYDYYGYTGNYYSHTGEGPNASHCLAGQSFGDAPCVNLNKTVTGSGETHKINLSYKVDPQTLAYFTYSTGYRPGGVNRNGNFGPYTSDTLTNYELGLKTELLDRTVTIDTALYDEDWTKFQFGFLGPNSLTIVENAPAANIKGAEMAASWRATDQLTLSASLTAQDPILSKNFCGTNANGSVIQNCSNSAAEAVSGSQLPYAPRLKGSLIARYNFPITTGWDGHLQGSMTGQGHSPVALLTSDVRGVNQVAALGNLPGYFSYDLSSGVEHGDASLELFVKNLTDERGQENRFLECTVGVCTNVYVVPINPRTIGIRLSQKF